MTTAALVGRAQRGDVDAYGEIYGQHRDAVFRFIHRRVGYSTEVAEDLTQETFLRGLRNIGRWEDQGRDIGAWLTTIARNLVTDHFKAAERRRTFSVGDFTEAGVVVADTAIEGDPETSAIDTMRDADLRSALARLNPDQRECVTNRFLREMSVAETAAAMGRNEGAIKSLTQRAIRTLSGFFSKVVSW